MLIHHSAKDGLFQEAGTGVLLAEIGSLSLEFTRLSQLSGDPKFFDAIQRIYDVFEAQQPLTKLPGMWPMVVNARETNFTDDKTFTFGAMADSTYEYLPKVITQILLHFQLLTNIQSNSCSLAARLSSRVRCTKPLLQQQNHISSSVP